jgi:DNA-binding LytR/AlgR family response regulator
MTYRRDLLDIRVVVRQSARHDQRADPPRRRVGGESAMHTTTTPPLNVSSIRMARPNRETEVVPETSPAEPAATGGSPEVILVKSGFKHVAIRVREILFVEAARNYVRLHMDAGPVLKSRVPIERLAQHLGNERFLRIHRGRLVNTERVRGVATLTGGRLRLTLSNGSTIVVARDRRRSVLAELGSLVARKG